MACNCASQGKVIPTCAESPIYRILLPVVITIGTIGITMMSSTYIKLPTQAKVLVAGISVAGLSYFFNLPDKASELLFNKHEESFKPISLSLDFEDEKFFPKKIVSKIDARQGMDKYQGLTLFYGTSKADIVSINCEYYMQPKNGYISEVQRFDPKHDKIAIECKDIQSISIIYKAFDEVYYTFVHLDGNSQSFKLAVQGVINEDNIDVI